MLERLPDSAVAVLEEHPAPARMPELADADPCSALREHHMLTGSAEVGRTSQLALLVAALKLCLSKCGPCRGTVGDESDGHQQKCADQVKPVVGPVKRKDVRGGVLQR